MTTLAICPSRSMPLGIGNHPAHGDRIGRLVHLVIDEIDLADLVVEGAVGQAQLELQVGRGPGPILRLLQLPHRHREGDVDRVHADDGGQGTAARAHEIADGVVGEADLAADRRHDVGVAEIDLRLAQRRLALLHVGGGIVLLGLALVDRRLRDVLAPHQRIGALVLDLGVGERGLGRGEIGLRLIGLGLELRLLDGEQQVARLDVLALREIALLEEALDASAQLDLVDRDHAADELEALLHGLARHLDHPDGRGRRCRLCRFLGLVTGSDRRSHRRDGGKTPQPTHFVFVLRPFLTGG